MKKITNKIIGHCTVDSGQLIIVDPCYLESWKDGEFYPDINDNHYSQCCNITLNNPNKAGEIIISQIAGKGVVTQTGDGDGIYPIKASYNKDNTITKITINFLINN